MSYGKYINSRDARRAQYARELRLAGFTTKQIAGLLGGVSRGRANQMVLKGEYIHQRKVKIANSSLKRDARSSIVMWTPEMQSLEIKTVFAPDS